MKLLETLVAIQRPKCAAVDQMHPGLRQKMDQAIINHDPPCLRDVMIQFQARSNGVPQSTFYRYARRLRAHAQLTECLELANIEGIDTAVAMTAFLDGEFIRVFTGPGEPQDPDDGYDARKPHTLDDKAFARLGQITLCQNRLSRTLLNRTKNLEATQRLAAGAPAGRPQPTMPNPASDPGAPTPTAQLPPLARGVRVGPDAARGDQGGFEKATERAAPATHPTDNSPQPPSAPAPGVPRSASPPSHKFFEGGPWKPRIDPAIEDAEDEAARKAGRPIPFDFDP